MRKKKRQAAVLELPMVEWVKMMEHCIAQHSGPVIKKGKSKGHSLTNTPAALAMMARAAAMHFERVNRGKLVDGNLGSALLLAKILLAWGMNCARAKTMDPNRPLALRKLATAHLLKHQADVVMLMNNPELMGEVWGKKQKWNFPFGRGAKGGHFV